MRYRNIWLRELGHPGKKEFQLADSVLASYAGSYSRGGNDTIEVTVEDRHLEATLGNVRFVLFAESPTKFFAKTTDVQMEFQDSDSGKANKLIWSVGEGANTATRVPTSKGK